MSNYAKEFNAEELELLHRHLPSAVRVAEDGAKIPLVSRAEVVALIHRYPSHYSEPAEPVADADERVLRARYPSMFAKKTTR